MKMLKYKRWIGGVLLFPLVLIFIDEGTAIAQASANYKMQKDVLDAAGAPSTSPSYKLDDAVGQPSAIGASASANYSLSAGFLAAPAVGAFMTVNFSPGWSWISFNVQPPNLAIEQVMAGLTYLAIMVNGAGQFYIPGVINTIGNLDIKQGYKVYFNAADQITLQGIQVPKATPIPLVAGWNFVAYLPATSMNVETALASIVSSLAIVKNDAGKFFIPGVINTLGDMTPKKGYKLYMNNSATLVFP
jgi:hypothetical protein